jgi:DNA-binding helix-hairpin-helix protein with protein kinase domain
MRVRLEGKSQEISLEGPLLGRGGEASIYAVPGRADLAAKIYHSPTEEQAEKLAAMLAAPPVPPPSRGEHMAIAWPVGRLLEAGGEGRAIGYLMPRFENAHLIWEFYNPAARQEICPRFHHGSLLRTARNLAAALGTLHERGYVVGDLNESNVLVTPQALVTLLDVDSFQVPGRDRVYRCRVGRPEYTPPELQGVSFADVDRSPEHDAFALAVLIFQLLMQGVHPFAGTCTRGGEPDSIPARIAAGFWPYDWKRASPIRPSPHAPPWFVLPPSVQECLRSCFEDGHSEPALRPGAAHWQHALEEAEHELTTCTSNPQHVHPRGLDRCPWCDLARQQKRDPFPIADRGLRIADSLPIRTPQSAIRNGESRWRRADSGERAEVDDPLPPRSEPLTVALPKPGWAELVLQAIGAGVERRTWIIWMGMAVIGAFAGFLYALHRALPDKSFGP